MSLYESATLYDLLDISSNASAGEVLEGYHRSKATFTQDSLALYTLVSPDEQKEALDKIEEAYRTLSDPGKRLEYDKEIGVYKPSTPPPMLQPVNNVISIDRVPPMESFLEGDNLLIPPTTDFDPSRSGPPPFASPIGRSSLSGNNLPSNTPVGNDPDLLAQYLASQSTTQSSGSVSVSGTSNYMPSKTQVPQIPQHAQLGQLANEESGLPFQIDIETEWSGSFLKKIREFQKISIEEMVGYTKITKTYIIAIEEENYGRLPATVYMRGFVSQIAKVLKLPGEKVATAYVSRYHRSRMK